MKIIVSKEDIIKIDDIETSVDKLTPDILENILEEGLLNNVEFDLPEDTSHPLASLMKELKELVSENSDFRNKLDELKNEQQENEIKINIAESENEDIENNE